MRRGLSHPARPAARPDDTALTVSELTRTVKTLLEGRIGTVAVTGETGGLKASPSGHVYFCLKDANALVDCVIWRSQASRIRNLPADGAKVTVRGKLTVYGPRGRYQLVVTSLSSAEEKGDLWARFEALKQKLQEEGLFDRERKVPLPPSPGTVGIVTSPGGAALRDILKILGRRAPNLRVVVSPAVVQGSAAPAEIARAVERLDRWGNADVIIVGRGGGSLEDLWAFNDEAVARAIAEARTPIVSAVGHETDFTIADFVADARAATPSEAAECVAPDHSFRLGRMAHAAAALSRALAGTVRERQARLRGLARERVFRQPEEMLAGRWQRIDVVSEALADAVLDRVRTGNARLDVLSARLAAMSPLAVLERGYAVLQRADGRVVTEPESVAVGEEVTARVRGGRVTATVTATQGLPPDV